jgi:hypothetical protein
MTFRTSRGFKIPCALIESASSRISPREAVFRGFVAEGTSFFKLSISTIEFLLFVRVLVLE